MPETRNARVDMPTQEGIRVVGFGNHACLEVTNGVGLFNHLTRLADGLGLRLDPGAEEASKTGVALERASGR